MLKSIQSWKSSALELNRVIEYVQEKINFVFSGIEIRALKNSYWSMKLIFRDCLAVDILWVCSV